jgi:hypothetical protein
MNKKLLTIAFVLLACVSFAQSNYHTPYDPGAARNTLSNVTPATGRAALGLGTMAVATSTDYVATSALALRLDTTNASFSGDIGVTGRSQLTTVDILDTLSHHTPLTTGVRQRRDLIAAIFPTTASGTATAALSIDIPDVGTSRAGAYTFRFTGFAGNNAISNVSTQNGGMGYSGVFTVIIDKIPTTLTISPVVDVYKTAGVTSAMGNRTVTNVVMTASATNLLSVDVLFEISCGGSDTATPVIVGECELISSTAFPPTITVKEGVRP